MWLSLLLLQGIAPSLGLLLHGHEGEAAGASAGLQPASRAGTRHNSARADVYYTAERLDQLRAFVQRIRGSSAQRQTAERQRLAAAVNRSQAGTADRAALEAALESSERQQAEAEAAALEVLEFYHTARAMLGAQGGAPSCRFLACGPHASCELAGGRARCVCRPCFQGDGFACSPASCGPAAAAASALPLLGQPPPGYPTVPHSMPQRIEELQVAVLARDHVAVVARAAASGDSGFLVVGRVGQGGVAWGPWQGFSASTRAFGPVVAGFPSGRLVLAYRDAQQGGTGYILGGQLNATGNLQAVLQAPQPFVRNLDQQMALVPLATARVACLYAGGGGTSEPFGGIALVQSGAGGALGILGKYRFVDSAHLSEITATALTPTSFVVGFRVLPNPSSPPGEPSRELSAVWVGMQDGELVVGPQPLALEPGRAGMRARSVALVSQDLFAYSYESGFERQTKVAIVRVDPATHRMTVAGGPQSIAQGNIAYVHGVSLPSGPASPKTFTYMQHPGGNSVGKVCSISPEGRIMACKDVMWADSELKAVSGSSLSGGQLVFAFANMAGEPFYQLLGTEESGTQDV